MIIDYNFRAMTNEILVFIDKNFHTYLVRDPYAFGNVELLMSHLIISQ